MSRMIWLVIASTVCVSWLTYVFCATRGVCGGAARAVLPFMCETSARLAMMKMNLLLCGLSFVCLTSLSERRRQDRFDLLDAGQRIATGVAAGALALGLWAWLLTGRLRRGEVSADDRLYRIMEVTYFSGGSQSVRCDLTRPLLILLVAGLVFAAVVMLTERLRHRPVPVRSILCGFVVAGALLSLAVLITEGGIPVPSPSLPYDPIVESESYTAFMLGWTVSAWAGGTLMLDTVLAGAFRPAIRHGKRDITAY